MDETNTELLAHGAEILAPTACTQNITGLLIWCAVWCVGIYGMTGFVTSMTRGFNVYKRTWFQRFIPAIPIAIGALSGLWAGPLALQYICVKVDMTQGAFFGTGAGMSASWVYSFVKQTVQSKGIVLSDDGKHKFDSEDDREFYREMKEAHERLSEISEDLQGAEDVDLEDGAPPEVDVEDFRPPEPDEEEGA